MGDYDDSLFWENINDVAVEQILALCGTESLTVACEPRTGLLMLSVKDSFDTDFYLGEVLVTDARVICCGVEGFGMVVGDHPRKALARAAADAVLRSGDRCAARTKLVEIITTEQEKRRKIVAESKALVAATRVSFDLM